MWHKISRAREVDLSVHKELNFKMKSKCPLNVYTFKVKQSWISTIFTTLIALIDSINLVFTIRPDIIVCNGPGEDYNEID